ncbi:hypothetical protein C8R43DRAFT_909514, partial [Mycena crocata]
MSSRKKRTKKQFTDFIQSLNEHNQAAELDIPDIRIPTSDDDDWLDNDLGDVPQDEVVGDRSDAVSVHAFAPEHPLYRTHYLRCDRRELELTVPNFVGGAFPRMDQGDREYYCCTMLTLFKPWHSGKDLKNDVDNWHEAFTDTTFRPKAIQLMKNFNVRYECNDARDDFSAQDRKKRGILPLFGHHGDRGNGELDPEELAQYGEEYLLDHPDGEETLGTKYMAREVLMNKIEQIVTDSGWIKRTPSRYSIPKRVIPSLHLTGSQWKIKVSQ